MREAHDGRRATAARSPRRSPTASTVPTDADRLGRHPGNAAVGRALRLRSTGRAELPAALRARIEHLSGLDMGDVTVRPQSPEPARFGAAALTRGSEIHLGPGQEQHLEHEAWHVVQQKRGAVPPTARMGGQRANLDARLEVEADRMVGEVRRGRGDEVGSPARPPGARPQPVLQMRFSSHDVTVLSFMTQVAQDPTALETLRSSTTRSAADLARLLQRNVPGTATIADLVALDRFTTAEIERLLPLCGAWGRVVLLASLPHSADDLADVLTNGAPTWQEAWDTLQVLTPDEIDTLAQSGANDWAAIHALAQTTQPDRSLTQLLHGVVAAWVPRLRDDVTALGAVGVAVDLQRYAAALIGTSSFDVDEDWIAVSYLADARYFSVCFDTAARLVDLAGQGGVGATSGGTTKHTRYPLAEQQERVEGLADALQDASGRGPVVFEVVLGAHGFTLTVHGQAAHQLEAFASQAGEPFTGHEDLETSLLTSILTDHAAPVATTTGYLRDIVGASPQERARGAGGMGWRPLGCGFVTAQGTVVDPMAVWWAGTDLAPRKVITLRLAHHVQRRREELFALLGAVLPETV